MARKNYILLTEFILLGCRLSGVTDYPVLPFFLWFIHLQLWECWNDSLNQNWFPTLHFFLANLSFVDVCYSFTITPKMLVDFFIREENHLLCWLLPADVFLYSLGHNWMHPFWVNGLWPLCGHMQPSPLRLDHVQDGLPENGRRGFYSGPGELNGSHRLYKQLSFLQFQCHPSLLLWHSSNF